MYNTHEIQSNLPRKKFAKYAVMYGISNCNESNITQLCACWLKLRCLWSLKLTIRSKEKPSWKTIVFAASVRKINLFLNDHQAAAKKKRWLIKLGSSFWIFDLHLFVLSQNELRNCMLTHWWMPDNWLTSKLKLTWMSLDKVITTDCVSIDGKYR